MTVTSDLADLADRATFDATSVGDVFVCSWGYDQTNVDFYLVVAKTAARVKVVQIGAIAHNSFHESSVWVVPNKGIRNGAPTTRTIRSGYQDKAYFSVTSYSSAYRWDGTPRYMTGAGWGH